MLKNILDFMKPEGLLPCSKEPMTGLCPDPGETSPHPSSEIHFNIILQPVLDKRLWHPVWRPVRTRVVAVEVYTPVTQALGTATIRTFIHHLTPLPNQPLPNYTVLHVQILLLIFL